MFPEAPTATNTPEPDEEVVVSSVVVVVVPEELELLVLSSFSPQEKIVRLKREIRKMCKILFVFSSIPKVKYYLYILLD